MQHSRAIFASLLVLGLFGLALGCATNPVTGKSELSIVTASQELEAGKQAFAATEAEYGFYADAGWSARVNTVGQKIASVSHLPTLGWQFRVVDDASVNAFAAPAGYIFVTRGILPYLNSEAQLAGVLGHECGHVTARHYNRMASRDALANLGLGLAGALSPTVAKFGQAAQSGLGLLFLKYSRDQENEADALGVQYSVKGGWDAREMPGTYRTLARISAAAGSSLPNYLSTHPDPASREVTVRQLAATAVGARTDLKIDHDGFVRALDGMVFGEDPQQGYFEGDHFYHPGLAFQTDFPAGWQHQNTRQTVMAATSDRAAVLQMTLVGLGSQSPSQYVAQLASSGKIVASDGRAETIYGRPAWVGRVTVKNDQGQTGVLVLAVIEQSTGRAFQVLGQTAQAGDAHEQAILATARSIRPLAEANRLSATPAHVKIVAAPRAGAFETVIAGLGAQGASVAETGILNDLQPGDPVRQGQLLKIVTPARLR
ncbi:MAG: M48 family metalloprotease [Candidatus Eisenbacteria bacterium]